MNQQQIKEDFTKKLQSINYRQGDVFENCMTCSKYSQTIFGVKQETTHNCTLLTSMGAWNHPQPEYVCDRYEGK